MVSFLFNHLAILQTLNIEPETLNYFKLQKKWPAWGGVTPPNGLFALL